MLINTDIKEIIDRTPELSLLKGKNVLVVGGNGFLGKYFCSVLKDYCKLTIVDNFITSEENNNIIKMDITNSSEFELFYENFSSIKFDYIIFLAGIASPVYYKKYPLQTIEIVTKGLVNCLEFAKLNKSRILFFGSSEIYGNPDEIPTSEAYPGKVSCIGDRSVYDESKRLGCTLVKTYHEQYNVDGLIVHPFNIYGPGFIKEDYRVLPNFFSSILSNMPLRVYGTGNQTRTFCYITDAIVGFLKVLINGKSGEVYNIGTPKPEITMFDLAKMVVKICKKGDIKLTSYPGHYPSNEPLRRCPNIDKAFGELGYNPIVSLEEGLSRYYEWAKQNYV